MKNINIAIQVNITKFEFIYNIPLYKLFLLLNSLHTVGIFMTSYKFSVLVILYKPPGNISSVLKTQWWVLMTISVVNTVT